MLCGRFCKDERKSAKKSEAKMVERKNEIPHTTLHWNSGIYYDFILKITSLWNYFFSVDEKIDQKKYIQHFFIDQFFFIAVTIMSVLLVLNYSPLVIIVDESGVESTYTGMLLYVDVILCLTLLILNRLSVIIRRLNCIGLSRVYVLLGIIPLLSIIFELFLMFAPLHKVKIENFSDDELQIS